jgi:hypothetical protein
MTFSWQEVVAFGRTVFTSAPVMVKSPLLYTLSAFLLPGKLQTLSPAVLVKHLAWVNLFVMCKALQSKKIGNMHVTFISTRPRCSRVEKIGLFIGRTCVRCLSVIFMGFVSCYDPLRKFRSYLISSTCSWNINTLCCFWHEFAKICCMFRPSRRI